MATMNESVFDCPVCETTAPSTAVTYDALGYAICPTCTHRSGPDAGRSRTGRF
ncbi:hypothetical protein [Halorubrum sp. CBA1125]|uniref:hypothetical protein n=1 Tax=Halorubrum sp. CBA1125 TaxID=2668072 RepID=UPI0018D20C52|nr:hypothetical protein [Halorubrum sp. CBA1125]